jgi:hypothetical protein
MTPWVSKQIKPLLSGTIHTMIDSAIARAKFYLESSRESMILLA